MSPVPRLIDTAEHAVNTVSVGIAAPIPARPAFKNRDVIPPRSR